MSAIGIPISQHAAALRIIGATMSKPRSSACTGPTVVASSPVPSHAFEMTPVRTQRFSSMSCRRPRSRPPYNRSLESGVRAATTAARSALSSIVERKPRTSAGSGFQSTYSGGSKAGNRFTSREFFFEFPKEATTTAGRFRRAPARQRLAELERRRKSVVGIGLQRLGERFLDGLGDIGAQRADRNGLAAQARDHHLLRIA